MSNGPLYSPLIEYNDEIRLITVLPYASKRSLVQCTLEMVSLKPVTTRYRDFLSITTSTGRRRTVEWENSSNPGTIISSEITSDKHNPDHPSHRFTWGDYATISYVWGEPTDTKTIILNGEEIQIQRNLESALRSLSSRAEFCGRYKLWVDAICINQHDSKEKSQQIRKMGAIYGDARAVIAWIGEESSNSDKAIDLVRTLSEARSKGYGEHLEQRLREDPEYLGLGNWLALHEFMRRKYWFRLWIIQEIVLGSSSAVLYCGNQSINWTTFCEGIGFLFEYLWTAKDQVLQREVRILNHLEVSLATWTTTSLHLVFRDLWALSQNEERGGEDYLSFGQLLDLGKSGEAQDDRDKVYGLVGMMDPFVAQSVIPDYSLSPSSVYASIARNFISAHRNLEVLREGNPWGRTQSPSWAADWTWGGRIRHARITVDLWGPFWRPKGRPPSNKLALPYYASGDKSAEVMFSGDGLHLACRGFIVDEVDGLSARESGYFNWAPHTIELPKSDHNAYNDLEGVIEALYRTLVSDRVAGGVRATERHAAILNMPFDFDKAEAQFRKLGWTWLANQFGYYFRWSGWRTANRNFMLFGKPLDEYFDEFIPDDASEYDYTEAYSCNNRTGQGRRFITTANGYIGWAPDNMFGTDFDQVESGDKIAIIFGCSTPIIIRPQGPCFQVLGESYIHGIMDGEALKFLESGQCETQDFIFC